jgi:hypothetical protein
MGSSKQSLPNRTRAGDGESTTLLGVVENDADGMTQSAADAADTVSEVDTVCAFRSFHGSVVHGEDHGIALRQRHHLHSALHARALFGQNELAAREVLTRSRQENGELQRKRNAIPGIETVS